MRHLLEKMLGEIEKLPAEEQDNIASRVLAELDDEHEWDKQFASTTGEQWDRMLEDVRRDIASGDTAPLEELLRPRKIDS